MLTTPKLTATLIAATVASSTAANDWPGDRITDEMRAIGIEMLKDAYRLNGCSMKGWGSTDMRRIYGPTQVPGKTDGR